MCSFLDSCLKCSNIIVPFLDTLTTAKLRLEQSSYLLSPSSLYVLELLADLQKVFVSNYLRKLDKDEEDVLICEAYRIAISASEQTKSCETKRADKFLESLKTDENQNILATFTTKDDNSHSVILNKRIAGRYITSCF